MLRRLEATQLDTRLEAPHLRDEAFGQGIHKAGVGSQRRRPHLLHRRVRPPKGDVLRYAGRKQDLHSSRARHERDRTTDKMQAAGAWASRDVLLTAHPSGHSLLGVPEGCAPISHRRDTQSTPCRCKRLAAAWRQQPVSWHAHAAFAAKAEAGQRTGSWETTPMWRRSHFSCSDRMSTPSSSTAPDCGS